MRYVSEKVLDEKIVEMKHLSGLGFGVFETQLMQGIHCLETLKKTCLDVLPDEKLRPMVELIESDELDALVWNKRLGRLVHFAYDNITESYRIYEFDYNYDELDDDQWLGWISMPKVSI